jgi:hypothetical protein
MLAPLAVFLLILLITCTLALLICWAYDHDGAEIDAGPSRPAILEFPPRPHIKRLPQVYAMLTHSPGGRAKSVINLRGAAQSLSPKRNSRRLRKTGIRLCPRRLDFAGSEDSYLRGE